MSNPSPNLSVRDALLAALEGRAVDGGALLNLNTRALEDHGVADQDAIDYWVHKHSTPISAPPSTTTPDPSQGGLASGTVESGRQAYERRHPQGLSATPPAGTQETGRDAYNRRHRTPGAHT